MRRRTNKGNVTDDSDEESDVGSDTPDSDDTVDMSLTTNKNKPRPKRKCGRPPATAKNKKQRLQSDSDDDGSPQPSTSQTVNGQNSTQGSESESDSDGDSDSTVDGTTNTNNAPRLRGQVRKRQKDLSPQPSTSRNADNQDSDEEYEESGSESADSDFGPVGERSRVKKKTTAAGKRQMPSRVAKPKKGVSNTVNGVPKQSQTNESTFDPKLVDSLAQKLVYFLLIEDQKKYAIRRKAIVTHVFKDDVYTAKLYSAVIKKANIILKKIYGMELMELENQKDCYLIVNILRRELGVHDYVELPKIKKQQHGLILYLLTVIFMNENVITEDELTKCLKPLDIDLTSKRVHAVFGDVKKYITVELVKQMYLNYVCISKDPPKYEFTWGLRAKQEFDKRDLLQFVCQIMDDTAPEDWRIQFGDAEESAKPETNAN